MAAATGGPMARRSLRGWRNGMAIGAGLADLGAYRIEDGRLVVRVGPRKDVYR